MVHRDAVLEVLSWDESGAMTTKEIAMKTGLDDSNVGHACRTLQRFKVVANHWKYEIINGRRRAVNTWWRTA